MSAAERTDRSFLKRLLGSFTRDGAASQPLRDARAAIARCRALLSERGEVSGARVAAEAIAAYQSLGGLSRDLFFDLLAVEFSPDPDEVGRAADAYRADPSPAHLIQLERVVEAPRQELFRRLNQAPNGTAVLVQMRRELLQTLADHPGRAGVDANLTHLFRSWFNRGFLVLQRIDWRTSAFVLEKLIEYEAVHQIKGWHDLRRRLQADRRCFAFFHPALRDEPLIFIEVALTRGVSAKVQPLIDPDSPVGDPAAANCAIFYSITNCQEGLRGVSFGNFLIKQVAEEIGREFSRIRVFSTLSPVPGFRRWLSASSDPLAARLASSLSALEGAGWIGHPPMADDLRPELLRLCAQYLTSARQGRVPLDPVERFHLANGARLERLNWMGDTSAEGLRRAAGITANYVYRLGDVEKNHEAYAREYEVVVSRSVERLAREPKAPRAEARS